MLVRNGVSDIGRGLQPELLADGVQSRGRRQGGNAPAHHAGDGTPAGLFLATKIWRPAGRVDVSYGLEIGDLAVIRERPLV